jgi:signal peptidase I
MSSSRRPYSLRKSRHILVRLARKAKHARLSPEEAALWDIKLRSLQQAIVERRRGDADRLARELESQAAITFAKPPWRKVLETVGALIIAIILATVIRQCWFELYSIPTGSMRPTLEEQNRLIVSKISYGINVPLQPGHLYFDPSLTRHTDMIVFDTSNLPIPNTETMYFYLFPTHKQYVKRLMGKPGDTIYFYGGQLYGVDSQGHDLLTLRNSPDIAHIEYVPMLQWDGKVIGRGAPTNTPQGLLWRSCILEQMGEQVARLTWNGHSVQGEISTPNGWVKDDSAAAQKAHKQIQTYSDFWGLRNYAMARLLTADQLKKVTKFTTEEVGDGLLYLELLHTPSASYPAPEVGFDRQGTIRPRLTPRQTVLPLQQAHLDRLMDQMTTSRFVVRNGRALPYSYEKVNWDAYKSLSVPLPNVPDGTYEFIRGTAYRIWWSGVRTRLASDHPLYQHDPSAVQTLYNLGIEWLSIYAPQMADQPYMPSRFAYFRDGALRTLGGVLLDHDDPNLVKFLEKETARQTASNDSRPYVAFRDWGPPLKADGSVDADLIRTFGYRIPDGYYLALGDNHAASLDSRDFGPVPEENLSGSPFFVFWPPDVQFGTPPQPPIIWWTVPHIVVWAIVIIILIIWWAIARRRNQLPFK